MAEKSGKPQQKNLHAGHRERMKAQFLKNGMSFMEDHVALEMLLYYSIPRGDTNPIAHRLIDAFGSFSAVLNAPYEELLTIEGVGPSSAMLLHMIPELCRRYQEDLEKEGDRVFDAESALRLIRPKFLGRKTEAVVLLLLNSKGEVVYCDVVTEGSMNAVPIYASKLVRLAARYDASSAILAHNHPSGYAFPTKGDIIATRHVIWALDSLNVRLSDHLIVTDNDYLSMSSSGLLESLYSNHEEEKEQRLTAASDLETQLWNEEIEKMEEEPEAQ